MCEMSDVQSVSDVRCVGRTKQDGRPIILQPLCMKRNQVHGEMSDVRNVSDVRSFCKVSILVEYTLQQKMSDVRNTTDVRCFQMSDVRSMSDVRKQAV